jgi:hypothetical protein
LLRPTKLQVGLSLNTNYAKCKFRAVRRIWEGASVSMEAGADSTFNDGSVSAYSRWLVSLRPLYNFKVYFGQQISIDGWTYIVGFKASGIKVLLPWTIEHEPNSFTHATIASVFMAANYFLTTLHRDNRKLQVDRWKLKNVPIIEEK